MTKKRSRKQMASCLRKKRQRPPWAYSGPTALDVRPYSVDLAKLDVTEHSLEEMIDEVEKGESYLDSIGVVKLMHHYGIPTNGEHCWVQLSLALAREYVPWFETESGQRGRPRKWTLERRRELFDDVQAKLQSSKNKSESWACKQLTKEYDMELEALYSQYKKVKREFSS